MKTYVHIKACIQMFIAALLTVAKELKQPQYQSTVEWRWSIHSMDYYSATKSNKRLKHVPTWMNIENIMLNERSESQRPHIVWDEVFRTIKHVETESRSVANSRVARSWGGGGGAMHRLGEDEGWLLMAMKLLGGWWKCPTNRQLLSLYNSVKY